MPVAVSSDLPLGARCSWDSRPFAGVWMPDTLTLTAARNYGGRTRRHFMRSVPARRVTSIPNGAMGTSRLRDRTYRRLPGVRGREKQRNLTVAGVSSGWTLA